MIEFETDGTCESCPMHERSVLMEHFCLHPANVDGEREIEAEVNVSKEHPAWCPLPDAPVLVIAPRLTAK